MGVAMQTIVGFLNSISLGYIFSFPIMITIFKFDSLKNLKLNNRRVINSLLAFIWLSIFNFAHIFLTDGTIAAYFILIWFILILPITIVFLLFVTGLSVQHDEEIKEAKKNFYGFSYKTVTILGLTIIVSLAFIISDTLKSTSIVLDYHKQFITKLSESKDQQLLLLEETIQPSYMTSDIIKDLNEIKNNKALISFALPWRIGITINSGTKENLKYWELQYVRNNKKWRLEGLYGKGSTETHIPNKID